MQRKTTLYIDIDDTIIAQILPGSGFDLRPCVITQLAVLGRMYDCCWLTSWPYAESDASYAGVPGAVMSVVTMSVVTLMRCLYGTRINETFRYADWDRDHPDGKAGFVLGEGAPEDWYWLEDPIPRGEQTVLVEAGKLDRYIPVEPTGPWGFLDAVNELFVLTGRTAVDIMHAGGRPEWFDRTALSSGE
ncbi:MAG: hypothetical protein WB561_22685 [Terracidiphilus sp.]